MLKIGSAQASAVAARGASTIRTLSQENDDLRQENTGLREKIASMERDQEIEALAVQMDEKGLNAEMTFEEKVAHIRKYDDLGRVKDAVEMAASGNIKLAEVTDEPGPGHADAFTLFCLNGSSEG